MAPRKRAGANPAPGIKRNRLKARRQIAGGGTAPAPKKTQTAQK